MRSPTVVLTVSLVVALASGCSAGRDVAQDTAVPVEATSARQLEPTPTSTQTPTSMPNFTAPSEVTTSFDRVLVSSRVGTDSGPEIVGATSFYIPGVGELDLDAKLLLTGEEIIDQRYTVAGPDGGLVIVLAAEIRVPGKGLTPGGYKVDLIAIDPTGQILARTTIAASETKQDMIKTVVGSHSDVVAISVYADNGEEHISGVDVRTGNVSWKHDGYLAAPTFDSITVETATKGTDGVNNPCTVITGFAVSSGNRLWSLDSRAQRLDAGKCKSLQILGSAGFATVNKDVATHDSMVVVNIGDAYTGGNVGYQVYEARSGKKLFLQSSRVDLYDPVKGFAYRDNSPSAWTGDRYTEPVTVYDTTTGKTLFELAAKKANELQFEATSLYDGYLHAKTADGDLMIDIKTGDVVTPIPAIYATGKLGEWTRYNDGVISLDPQRTL